MYCFQLLAYLWRYALTYGTYSTCYVPQIYSLPKYQRLIDIIMKRSENTNKTRAMSDDARPVGLGIYLEGGPRWSGDSNNHHNSSGSHKTEIPPKEAYEDKLSRYRKFFDNGPLMRCLDKDEDEQQAREVLFNTLLKDVQQNRLDNYGYRGVIQIRSFWEDVRKQLRVDEYEEASPRSHGRSKPALKPVEEREQRRSMDSAAPPLGAPLYRSIDGVGHRPPKLAFLPHTQPR